MTDLKPAKLTDRFLAYLVDFVPFVAGCYATLYLLIVRFGLLPNVVPVWRAAFAAWLALYLAYQAAGNLSGGTFGKRLFGLRVADLEGRPLGVRRSVIRALGYLASTPLLNLGFLWSLFEPRSRAWHDLLAGSWVVEDREKSPAAAAVSAGASLLILCALAAANVWFFLGRPSSSDRAAVARARAGLEILAGLQEAHRAAAGGYTDRLADLARASGDVARFREEMETYFHPHGFVLRAGTDGYSVSARARDRRRTVVTITGP